MRNYSGEVEDLLREAEYVAQELEDELWDAQEEIRELERRIERVEEPTDLAEYMFYNHPTGAHVEWDSVLSKWIVNGRMI